MIKIVEKRDGYLESFKAQKIESAILKAMIEADEVDVTVAKTIAENIAYTKRESVNIEEIQDITEILLMEHGKKNTAKAFILYRKQRAEKRSVGWQLDELQNAIWEKKYKHGNETFDKWLDRVSGGNKKLRKLIKDKKFIFAGRILAHRGVSKNTTYSNCYVMPPVEDNLESIFDTAKFLARTYSYGGGCGLDISNLRPRGSAVNNSAKETTGAVSFMPLYDLTTDMIGQNGRRGALMLSIADTHPDLPEFINVKTKDGAITKANISIRISHAFMEAVANDGDWTLSFTTEAGEVTERVVRARELFRMNSQNNWDWAEAGMLYWDTITGWHLMSAHPEHEYVGVNPCAEEPLMSGGSCLLGSINLAEFVAHPFTEKARFDFHKFRDAIRTATIGLNEVLDEGIDRHPLQIQRDNARDWRQIGLGVMGIADMLIKMGIRYGTIESIDLNNKISHELINQAVYQSAMLAKDNGTFPKYNKEALMNSEFYQKNITGEVHEVVEQYGLNNSQLLTIAPNGSISTMWGISGGIEPIFAVSYKRKTESLHGEEVTYEVFTPIVKELMKALNLTDKEDLPYYVVASHELPWNERVNMQAIWQQNIDASISSTVNLSSTATVEDVEKLFMYAWSMGLKGITIFRDGCKRAGILTTADKTQDVEEQDVEEEIVIEETNAYASDTKYTTCKECGAKLEVFAGACSICLKCGSSACE